MIHKWWHRLIRKRTAPIPEETAVLWKRRLSIAYGLLAWNAFGVVLYSAYKGKADWADFYGLKSDDETSKRPGHSFANVLGIQNAKVYRISGFTKVDEYDIEEGKIKENKPEIKIDPEELKA